MVVGPVKTLISLLSRSSHALPPLRLISLAREVLPPLRLISLARVLQNKGLNEQTDKQTHLLTIGGYIYELPSTNCQQGTANVFVCPFKPLLYC